MSKKKNETVILELILETIPPFILDSKVTTETFYQRDRRTTSTDCIATNKIYHYFPEKPW